MIKTSGIIIILYSIYISGYTQPLNDYCSGAIILTSTVDTLKLCNGAGETWSTEEINFINAASEINITGCALGEVPAVWYKIEADTVPFILSLKVKGKAQSRPTMQIFSGSCNSLVPVTACATGMNGELYISELQLAPGIDYYLVCGDAAETATIMTLHFIRWQDKVICVFDDEIRPVYRSGGLSELGPYFPGDTVGFEYTIAFLASIGPQNCQWFQGVVPVFGSGWDPSSFDSLGRPMNATLNDSLFPVTNLTNATAGGSWDWWTNIKNHSASCNRFLGDFDGNGTLDMCDRRLDPDCMGVELAGACCGPCWDSTSPDSSGTGDLLPPGWFSSGVIGSCHDYDGWPAVDWGDGNTCGGLTGPWKFYFELIVSDSACSNADPGAFSMTMFPLADGELGAWTGGASYCALDVATRYDATITCCEGISETVFLSGHLFGDLVSDCTYDGNEPGIVISPIAIRNIATNESSLVLSNARGDFVVEVDTGTYWIIPQLDTIVSELCPDSIMVSALEPCSVVTTDLAIDSDLLCFEDAFLRVSVGGLRQCTQRYLRVELLNNGTVELTDLEVHLQLSEMVEFISSNQSYDSLGGNEFIFSLDPIPVFGTARLSVLFLIPCEVAVGYEHCFTATLLEDLCSGSTDAVTICRETIMRGVPFDPNFKVDAKDMSLDITQIVDSSPIEYEIHFQNVGTAPAERVTILDTLPELLNPATFIFKGSSHDVEISLLDNHILQFFFDNINLPDSTADEPGSHGQVIFEITPVPDLVAGQTILNNAAIYFDFNEPVITNEKQHLVACAIEIVFDSVSVVLDNGTGNGAVYLFPPDSEEYTFEWSNGSNSNSIVNVVSGEYTVTVTNVSGCIKILTFDVLLNTGIANSEWDINVFLHPNPVSDIIFVHMETPIASVLEILTLNGSTLWIGPLPAEQESGISLGFIPPGMYLCKISSPLGVRILKFIKR